MTQACRSRKRTAPQSTVPGEGGAACLPPVGSCPSSPRPAVPPLLAQPRGALGSTIAQPRGGPGQRPGRGTPARPCQPGPGPSSAPRILGLKAGELGQQQAAALSDGLLGGRSGQVPLERQDLLLLPLRDLQLSGDHLSPGLLVRQGARWVRVIAGDQAGGTCRWATRGWLPPGGAQGRGSELRAVSLAQAQLEPSGCGRDPGGRGGSVGNMVTVRPP